MQVHSPVFREVFLQFFINRTEEYHRNDIKTLGWELTVCNSLEFEESPPRKILEKNATYGEMLGDYIFSFIDKKKCRSLLEIGGGYGFLMRDLLMRMPNSKACMIDISPMLLNKQKQTLEAFDVRFIESDFFDLDQFIYRDHDLVILNEIVGDFQTACNLTLDMIDAAPDREKSPLSRVKNYLKSGFLSLPDSEPFNVNIGAMDAVQKLCSLSIPYIFISEHSCEADQRDEMSRFLKLSPTKNPEEIKLIGHSEFTVCFSNLESIARHFGYKIVRGPYSDFIKVFFSPKIRFILTSNSQKDEHEMIRQFIHDLYKYEYLLLILK
jgi:hypothetical protein